MAAQYNIFIDFSFNHTLSIMQCKNKNQHIPNIIEDFKGDQSWRIFRIISEFTEGFDRLADVRDAISIFGSARLKSDHLYHKKTVELAELLGQHGLFHNNWRRSWGNGSSK